jgi:hypothetical protein
MLLVASSCLLIIYLSSLFRVVLLHLTTLHCNGSLSGCVRLATIMSTNSLNSSSSTASDSSSSSPEENSSSSTSLYLVPSFIRDREDIGWRAYFSSTELLSNCTIPTSPNTSEIFSHLTDTTTDTMRSQAGFLYDYYGMTEDTRLDPPSPGHSHTNEEKDHMGVGVDIPGARGGDDDLSRHTSFADSMKSSIGYCSTQTLNSSRSRSQSSPSPSSNREKMLSPSSGMTSCQSPPLPLEDEMQRGSFNYVQKQGFTPQDQYIFTLEAQTSIVHKRGCESNY